MNVLYLLFNLHIIKLNKFFFFCRNLPFTRRIKERINSGYWDRTPEEEYRLEMIKRNLNPDSKDLLRRRDEILTKNEPIEQLKI